MDFYKEFATDEKLEKEGAWIAFNTEISFKIARTGNKNFGKVFRKLYSDNQKALALENDEAEALAFDIMLEAHAKAILVDWKGPVEYKGETLAYSWENAKKLLALKEFREWVEAKAENLQNFKISQENDELKN